MTDVFWPERRIKNAEIRKSPHDPNTYKFLRLENGLEVVVVSTPHESTLKRVFTRTKRMCSTILSGDKKPLNGDPSVMTANINSGAANCDPRFEGLAHLVEHCVFGPTEKYHKYDYEIDRFIDRTDSMLNGATGMESLEVYIATPRKHFDEGLDRFAQLLTKATFPEHIIYNEVHIIDAEFYMRSAMDVIRLLDTNTTLASPIHPMGLYICGNLHSFRPNRNEPWRDLRTAMQEFYRDHFHAENMTICVLSDQPMAKLESSVRNLLSMIPPKPDPPPPRFRVPGRGPPFSVNPMYFMLHKFIPNVEIYWLSFQWELPCQKEFYEKKSTEYIGALLAHHYTNGLVNMLEKRGWITEFMAGTENHKVGQLSFCTLFGITIYLTDRGANHIVQIVRYVYQFMHKLRQTQPLVMFWNEMKKDAELKFRFMSDPYTGIEYVDKIVNNMQWRCIEDILCHEAAFIDFDPNHIMSLLNMMTPDKCRLMIIDHRFKEQAVDFPVRDSWTCFRCKIEEYSNMWKRIREDDILFQQQFDLPKRNPYSVRDLNVYRMKGPLGLVEVLAVHRGWTLSYGIDEKSDKPLCSFTVRRRRKGRMDERSFTIQQILMSCFSVMLGPHKSYFESVGHNIALGNPITFSGFSDTLPQLIKDFFSQVNSFRLTTSIFQSCKNTCRRKLLNNMLTNERLADNIRGYFFQTQFLYTSNERVMESISKISVENLALDFIEAKYDFLLLGNMKVKDAKDMFHEIAEQMHIDVNRFYYDGNTSSESNASSLDFPGFTDSSLGSTPPRGDSTLTMDDSLMSFDPVEGDISFTQSKAGCSPIPEETDEEILADDSGLMSPKSSYLNRYGRIPQGAIAQAVDGFRFLKVPPGNMNSPPRRHYIRLLTKSPNEKSSYISNYYYFRMTHTQLTVVLFLSKYLISAEFKEFFRVHCLKSYTPTVDVDVQGKCCGLNFKLVSPATRFNLSDIDVQIDAFLQAKADNLNFTEEWFNHAKEVARERLATKTSWKQRCITRWHEVRKKPRAGDKMIYDYVEQNLELIQILYWLTPDVFKQWFKAAFSQREYAHSKVSVQIIGYGEAALNDCVGGAHIWAKRKKSPVVEARGQAFYDDVILQPVDPGGRFYARSIEEFSVERDPPVGDDLRNIVREVPAAAPSQAASEGRKSPDSQSDELYVTVNEPADQPVGGQHGDAVSIYEEFLDTNEDSFLLPED